MINHINGNRCPSILGLLYLPQIPYLEKEITHVHVISYLLSFGRPLQLQDQGQPNLLGNRAQVFHELAEHQKCWESACVNHRTLLKKGKEATLQRRGLIRSMVTTSTPNCSSSLIEGVIQAPFCFSTSRHVKNQILQEKIGIVSQPSD